MDTGEEERTKEDPSKSSERKDYNIGVLKHVQTIFAHLACSKLQYYVPKGFWKHFRLLIVMTYNSILNFYIVSPCKRAYTKLV